MLNYKSSVPSTPQYPTQATSNNIEDPTSQSNNEEFKQGQSSIWLDSLPNYQRNTYDISDHIENINL